MLFTYNISNIFAKINICLIFKVLPRKDSYKRNESKSIIFLGSSCILFNFLPESLKQCTLPLAVYRNALCGGTLTTVAIIFKAGADSENLCVFFIIVLICVILRLNFFFHVYCPFVFFSWNFFAKAHFPTEVFIYPIVHPLPASFNNFIRYTFKLKK